MDVTGLSNGRRRFFGLQIEISQSRTMEEFWDSVCKTLDFLRFNRADFWLTSRFSDNGEDGPRYRGSDRRHGKDAVGFLEADLQAWQTSIQHGHEKALHWARGHYRRKEDVLRECMLKVEVPLTNGSLPETRTLFVLKDAKQGRIDDTTLKRVWQLRETMIKTLEWMEVENRKSAGPPAAMVGKSSGAERIERPFAQRNARLLMEWVRVRN
jgi:hypothetical protein